VIDQVFTQLFRRQVVDGRFVRYFLIGREQIKGQVREVLIEFHDSDGVIVFFGVLVEPDFSVQY